MPTDKRQEKTVSTQHSHKSILTGLYPVEIDMTPTAIEARSQAGQSTVLDRSYQLFPWCVNGEEGTAPDLPPPFSYAWLQAMQLRGFPAKDNEPALFDEAETLKKTLIEEWKRTPTVNTLKRELAVQPKIEEWFKKIRDARTPRQDNTLEAHLKLEARLKVIQYEWGRKTPTINKAVSQQVAHIKALQERGETQDAEKEKEVETLIHWAANALGCDRTLVECMLDAQRQEQFYAQTKTQQHLVGDWLLKAVEAYQLLPHDCSIKPQEGLPCLHHQGKLQQLNISSGERVVLAGGYAPVNSFEQQAQRLLQKKQHLRLSNEALRYVLSKDRFVKSVNPDDMRWLQVQCATAEAEALRKRFKRFSNARNQDAWHQVVVSQLEQEQHDLLRDHHALRTSAQLDYVAHRLNFIRYFSSIAHRLPPSDRVTLLERGLGILQRVESLARLGDSKTVDAVLCAFYNHPDLPNNIESLAYSSIKDTDGLKEVIGTLWNEAEQKLGLAAAERTASALQDIPPPPEPQTQQLIRSVAGVTEWQHKDQSLKKEIEDALLKASGRQRSQPVYAERVEGKLPQSPAPSLNLLAPLFSQLEQLTTQYLQNQLGKETLSLYGQWLNDKPVPHLKQPDRAITSEVARALFILQLIQRVRYTGSASDSVATVRVILKTLQDEYQDEYYVEGTLCSQLRSATPLPNLPSLYDQLEEVALERGGRDNKFVRARSGSFSPEQRLSLGYLSAAVDRLDPSQRWRPREGLNTETSPFNCLDAPSRVTPLFQSLVIQLLGARGHASLNAYYDCARCRVPLGMEFVLDAIYKMRQLQMNFQRRERDAYSADKMSGDVLDLSEINHLFQETAQALSQRTQGPTGLPLQEKEISQLQALLQAAYAQTRTHIKDLRPLVQAMLDSDIPEQWGLTVTDRPTTDRPLDKTTDRPLDKQDQLIQQKADHCIKRIQAEKDGLTQAIALKTDPANSPQQALAAFKALEKTVLDDPFAFLQNETESIDLTSAAWLDKEKIEKALTKIRTAFFEAQSAVQQQAAAALKQQAEPNSTDSLTHSFLEQCAHLGQAQQPRRFPILGDDDDDESIEPASAAQHSNAPKPEPDWLRVFKRSMQRHGELEDELRSLADGLVPEMELRQRLGSHRASADKIKNCWKAIECSVALAEVKQAIENTERTLNKDQLCEFIQYRKNVLIQQIAAGKAVDVSTEDFKQDVLNHLPEALRKRAGNLGLQLISHYVAPDRDASAELEMDSSISEREDIKKVDDDLGISSALLDIQTAAHLMQRPEPHTAEDRSLADTQAAILKDCNRLIDEARQFINQLPSAKDMYQYTGNHARYFLWSDDINCLSASENRHIPPPSTGSKAIRAFKAFIDFLEIATHALTLADRSDVQRSDYNVLLSKFDTVKNMVFSEEGKVWLLPGLENLPWPSSDASQPKHSDGQAAPSPALSEAIQSRVAESDLDLNIFSHLMNAPYSFSLDCRTLFLSWGSSYNAERTHEDFQRTRDDLLRPPTLTASVLDMEIALRSSLPKRDPQAIRYREALHELETEHAQPTPKPLVKALQSVNRLGELDQIFSDWKQALQPKVQAEQSKVQADYTQQIQQTQNEMQAIGWFRYLPAWLSSKKRKYNELIAQRSLLIEQAKSYKEEIAQWPGAESLQREHQAVLEKQHAAIVEQLAIPVLQAVSSVVNAEWSADPTQQTQYVGVILNALYGDCSAVLKMAVLKKMTNIEDQNGLLAGLLQAGRNGNNPFFAAAKQWFEDAQEKIRNHLIHKLTESAEATDNPTQDLRKLGTHWEAFCKNASWPPALIDFIKQDKARNGALEQAKALHETAAVQAERAVLTQGVETLSLADFPHAQPIQNGNLRQVTEQSSLQAHIDQGQFTLDHKLGELCRGTTRHTLPLRFGLPLGHWDAWTEAFGVDATDLLPACEAGSAFMAGLRQRLQQDLKLESAELLLLLCRSGWNDVRNHLQSLLPPDYLIQDAQAEGFQNSVFRGEDGYLYQITSCSNMAVLDENSKTIPINGQLSFVARLTLEGPQWIAQWASNAELTHWLSRERTTATTPPELQALSQKTAKAEQGQPTFVPHRWSTLPPPKDATEAEKEKTLLTALNTVVETLLHTPSLKEAQKAHDRGVTIINQSSLSDRIKDETQAMLSGPVKALQSRQWEEQKRLAGAGTAAGAETKSALNNEEIQAMIAANHQHDRNESPDEDFVSTRGSTADNHQQALEQYNQSAAKTKGFKQATVVGTAELGKAGTTPVSKNFWSFLNWKRKSQTMPQPVKQDANTSSNHVMVSSKG